jgi:hypothetical protein
MIQGFVNDVYVGAESKVASGELRCVPAMFNASQSKWVKYIYMQKPMPTDATGVAIVIFATDAGGHTEQIATVNSGSSGLYSYEWVPAKSQ